MNALQKSILATAKRNLFAIRVAIGDRETEKIILQICKEEKDHRSWGRDFARFRPIAPSVRNVAIVDLSYLWTAYAIKGRQIARGDVATCRLSHVLVWSYCEGKDVALENADFSYTTLINGKAESNNVNK